MGSAVWAKGIVQEINARLPAPVRKSVEHDVAAVTVTMWPPRAAFRAAVAIISKILANVVTLPVIFREIQDNPVAGACQGNNIPRLRPSDGREGSRQRQRR